MGISKIEIENYKSFEKASLVISPITMLLGANSIGKSSIIQLILMLSQTFNKNSGKGNLLLNSTQIELGDDINLLKDKNPDKKLKIKLSMSNNVNIFTFASIYLDRLISSVYKCLRECEEIYYLSSEVYSDVHFLFEYLDEIKKIRNEYRRNLNRVRSQNSLYINLEAILENSIKIINKTKRFIKKYLNSELATSPDENIVNLLLDNQAQELINKITTFNTNYYLKSFTLINDLYNYKISDIQYIFIYKKDKLILQSCKMFDNNLNFFTVSYYNDKTNRKNFFLSSDIISEKLLTIIKNDFSKNLNFRYLKPFWKDEKRNLTGMSLMNIINDAPIGLFLYMILEKSISKLSSRFRRGGLKHVKPIRAYPRRYYFVKEEIENRSLVNINEGEEIITILQDKPTLLCEINKWLKDKYNLEISIKPINDIIYSIGIIQNELELDISDVGFGISQILPILIQLLTQNNNGYNTIIIEQPEIHIHPKAQADLLDLFILIVNKYQKEIIIETHSESFLKRLRRRMSEFEKYEKVKEKNRMIVTKKNEVSLLEKYKKTAIQKYNEHEIKKEEHEIEKEEHEIEKENPLKISSDRVSIHSFERENNATIINNTNISADGDFDWPKEFLDYALDDTIEFLKNQG